MSSRAKSIGVLALQGAVEEHLKAAHKLGFSSFPVKNTQDLQKVNALIIPGGESTSISYLIQKHGLFDPIRSFAEERPILGTCAGLILCSSEVLEQDGCMRKVHPLNLIPCVTSRNGFGRQIDSFELPLNMAGVGRQIPAVFIRAPYIERVAPEVNVLAELKLSGSDKKKIVAAECGNVLVTAFHPELTDDLRVMEYFSSKIA